MTTTTLPDIESLSFKIELETRVMAPIDVTFAALLEQLGPGFEKDVYKRQTQGIYDALLREIGRAHV